MAALQERYRAWEAREGMVVMGHLPIRQAGVAVQRSLPTMLHARRFVDALAEALGPRLWEDPSPGPGRRVLHVRDPEDPDLLVPTPICELTMHDGPAPGEFPLLSFVNPDAVLPEDAPDGWKPGDPAWYAVDPEPDVFPQGPEMQAGTLRMGEGPERSDWSYDHRGLFCRSVDGGGDSFWCLRYFNTRPYAIDPLARPPQRRPLKLKLRPDLDPRGHTPERLAEMAAELDPASRVPARVLLPLPVPGGPEGVAVTALFALQRRSWDGLLPATGGWVAIDGFDQTAVAWGATRDEALARWRTEVERVRPRPPEPRATPRPEPEPPVPDTEPSVERDDEGRVVRLSTGTLHIEVGPRDPTPWPIPLPRFVPAMLLPVPALPPIPDPFARAGFTRWLHVFDDHGHPHPLLVRERGTELTLVGGGVVDIVDPATLDAAFPAAAAQAEEEYRSGPMYAPHHDWTRRHQDFHVWDNEHRAPLTLMPSGWGIGPALTERPLLTDTCYWKVTRYWEVGG